MKIEIRGTTRGLSSFRGSIVSFCDILLAVNHLNKSIIVIETYEDVLRKVI
jgi:hypothetical protein